ncbi:MAG TPA: serine/threonine-protein kinase [Candidatus Methylacidiphilales bacterium]|jgi:serine/threonine protein kinase|nr:serine/threonine-protein kinase [Candidatus Methylacidiphilales bacterium]
MIHTRIADRYVLLAPLGAGGEARVFRARDEQSGGEVAVRLALVPVASVLSAAPGLTHEGWVRFIDSGIDPQHGAYQVFELLEGQTLGEIVPTAPLPRGPWREFVGQSLAAVEALHRVNWVHADLNADNFFRTAAGWKLLELPFHRFETPAARSTMFGSIYTLAPEQIDGAKPGVPSDLYSLGCLYYYAACGCWPHTGDTVQQIAIERLIHPAPDLRELSPGLPASWADWVMKLLALKPGDRFSSASTARQLLAEAVA